MLISGQIRCSNCSRTLTNGTKKELRSLMA